MLNLVQVPTDLFQFFVISGFLTGRLGSMVAVMNLFALTILGDDRTVKETFAAGRSVHRRD